jgi:hypothetical protein
VQIGGNEAMLARLRLPETRARIKGELADHGLNNADPSWEAVQIFISPAVQKRPVRPSRRSPGQVASRSTRSATA